MAEFKINPPYYGGEYSPEIGDFAEVEFDIAMMKKAGFNIVKIGEKSWSIIERTKGNFDFPFFEDLVKKLYKNEIGVVFSLPLFAPPMWLREECPDLFSEESLKFCLSDINYIDSSFYMAKKLVGAFASYENILSWNISIPNFEPCFCENCRDMFSKYLSQKYGESIEKLNLTLNSSAQTPLYASFTDVARDKDSIISNPQLMLEWHNFRVEALSTIIKTAKTFIKKETKKPLSISVSSDCFALQSLTELSDIPDISYDFCRRDKYLPFNLSRFSSFSFKRFFASANFENSPNFPIEKKEENFHRLRALFPLFAGGDGSIYWFFRNHHSGKMTECDALLTSDGRPTIHFDEAMTIGKDIKKAADFLNNTRSFGAVALQYSSFSKRFFETQKNFRISDYDSLIIDNFYDPIRRKGVSVDIVEGETDLADYKMLFSPMTVTLESSLGKKIEKWVNAGGIWVCGPLSDIRDKNGIKYKRAPFGNIESMANAYLFHRLFSKKPMKASWNDGKAFEGFLWYDIFEASENDIVKITDEDKQFVDKSLVKVCPLGKGKIILLGTFPSFADMVKITETALSFVKLQKFRCSENIWFSHRSGYDDFGNEYKGMIVAEYKGKEGSARLTKAYVDLLSGRMMKGIIRIKPYEAFVLEEVTEK